MGNFFKIPEWKGVKLWGPISGNPEGIGVIGQIHSVEVVLIFSGTTQ